MLKTGPFFKRFCSHTAMAAFGLTWLIGLARDVALDRIFIRSLVAATLFWMLGAFMARYAFRPFPPEEVRPRGRAPGSPETE